MGAGTGQRQEGAAPAVTVHSVAQAAAALAAAGQGGVPGGVLLLSAPGAAGSLGAPWFLAMIADAATAQPGVPHRAALDCGDAPGQALAALRAGARLLILDPACPGFAAVAAAAAETGAKVWPARPASLDLGRSDPGRPGGRRRLAAWLAGGGR
ncbi:hypothetical protein [Siccirubricoccus sp. G192]|uniref:hypothetical protein n=1 Tax=Siccirubricoccus sp. G192 TaxID=2849651 RepID=UPI001C2C2C0B|nr:hypothetical protein [Siccirubricoccus sp. G192]MBV1798001.1 hypothetical protein [Siccirubricoccus sp. G192]